MAAVYRTAAIKQNWWYLLLFVSLWPCGFMHVKAVSASSTDSRPARLSSARSFDFIEFDPFSLLLT